MFDVVNTPVAGVIARTPSHLYLAPHRLLRPYIAHYTIMPNIGGSLPRTGAPQMLTLMPDASGCIVMEHGERGFSAALWGPTTRTVRVSNAPAGGPAQLFVEFLPGGAHRLTGLAQEGLADRQFPLTDCLPALYASLNNAVHAAGSVAELTGKLDNIFLWLLATSNECDTARLVSLLNRSGGSVPVCSIANALCYSERHLNRLCHEKLGMNMKTYLRILRVNLTLQNLRHTKTPLALLAQESGYCDQPHFIHDFKAICGVTPTVFSQNLSEFYNEAYKFNVIINNTNLR